ncbi:membrane protein [Microtetraspora sp. NBRC 13810]|uniref:YidC/Oxa1 family membrane protein insertase n=1 Tax=Microtetraspora sp. NBRC 13810 TaxID=3030990 RepID=UPI0024A15D26|nr:membrane protein insertase YidC [Microtetraspora sp. NBRC 13810]GLW09824.1 membrane protein [Microtetraspora sp. NBRC 13810]
MFDPVIDFTTGLLAAIADLVTPLAGGNAQAVAIILLTLAVRLSLLPLSVLAARGERSRLRLAPELARLNKRYARNRERLQREVAALYAREKSSPLAGCLPSLAQVPFFMLIYQVAAAPSTHTLFGAPLGQQVASVIGGFGLFSVPTLAMAVLLALLFAVAWATSRRIRLTAAAQPAGPAPVDAVRRIMPLMPYGTVLAALVLPVATGLYLLASTTWTMVERATLYPKPGAATA